MVVAVLENKQFLLNTHRIRSFDGKDLPELSSKALSLLPDSHNFHFRNAPHFLHHSEHPPSRQKKLDQFHLSVNHMKPEHRYEEQKHVPNWIREKCTLLHGCSSAVWIHLNQIHSTSRPVWIIIVEKILMLVEAIAFAPKVFCNEPEHLEFTPLSCCSTQSYKTIWVAMIFCLMLATLPFGNVRKHFAVEKKIHKAALRSNFITSRLCPTLFGSLSLSWTQAVIIASWLSSVVEIIPAQSEMTDLLSAVYRPAILHDLDIYISRLAQWCTNPEETEISGVQPSSNTKQNRSLLAFLGASFPKFEDNVSM